MADQPQKALLQLVPPAVKVQPGVIEYLEDYLRQAREGRVVSLAIAVVRPTGDVSTAITASRNKFELLGAVRYLEHRMLTEQGWD